MIAVLERFLIVGLLIIAIDTAAAKFGELTGLFTSVAFVSLWISLIRFKPSVGKGGGRPTN